MVSKVTESEKRNHTIAQLLQKEQEDSRKSENSQLLQLEARMERQLMDFDIEREQYKTRLRKEECKVRDLLLQLTDIKETVLSLQQDSNDSQSSDFRQGIHVFDSTDSASLPGGSNITPVSLIKSISHAVTVSQHSANHQINLPTVVALNADTTSTNHGVIETLQQTARVDAGPCMSPPAKESSKGTPVISMVQPNLNSASASFSKSRQSTVAPSASQKPSVSQIIHRMPAESQAGPASRISYYRQDAPSRPTGPTSSPASVRPPHISNVKITSMGSRGVINMGESTSTMQPGNTAIPTRVFSRNPAAKINSAPLVSTKPVILQANKISNTVLKVSATPNNSPSRPMSTSPRSVTVPPHLGSAASSNFDSKLVNVTSWRNSVPPSGGGTPNDSVIVKASRPVSASLISPPDTLITGSISNKPKPPPPIRNVSLPPTKKYQSVENTS